MKHSQHGMRAIPERPKPSLHLSDKDVPGIGSLEVGSMVSLAVSGRVMGIHEEQQYDEHGKSEGTRHRMVMVELSKIERQGEAEHYPVKIGRM